jgi:uncharacterized protein (DUF2252 family)
MTMTADAAAPSPLDLGRFSPFALARHQLALDEVQTRRWPVLLPVKRAKVLTSPFALLRGSARFFHELIVARGDTARLPTTVGWIVGDMHLENVGAYRNHADDVVFDLNDFDEAAVGPWALDTVRLATSALLAGRAWQATGPQCIRLCWLILEEHRRAAFVRKGQLEPAPPPEPKIITQLLGRARKRSKTELLDARAPVLKGSTHRRFQRGDRYLDLPPEVEAAAPALMGQLVTALAGHDKWGTSDRWKVVDACQRVAGNGSLGCLRVAMVVESTSEQERLVEFKEMSPSSVSLAYSPDPATALPGALASPAVRVAAAGAAMLANPPRFWVPLPGALPDMDLLARQLFPQEDKLKLEKLGPGEELDGLARTVGFQLGAAHRRGIGAAEHPAWTDRELAAIVDVAIELAGIHEAAYLAYVRLCESRS